jgi:hypothetical protein
MHPAAALIVSVAFLRHLAFEELALLIRLHLDISFISVCRDKHLQFTHRLPLLLTT